MGVSLNYLSIACLFVVALKNLEKIYGKLNSMSNSLTFANVGLRRS